MTNPHMPSAITAARLAIACSGTVPILWWSLESTVSRSEKTLRPQPT
jgi:hypothetical protein